MPIWTNPPRKLLTTLRRMRADAAARGQANEIEFMPVDAVNADSTYEVGDVAARVPATGTAQNVRAGERVPVAKVDGQPVAIFAHTARRAQFHPVLPAVVGQIVEELFFSGDRSTGVFDLYFRNFDQVTPLGLSSFVSATNPPNSAPTSLLRWGAGTDRFLLKSGNVIRVFKLNRTPNKSYAPGQKAKATLVQTVNLLTVAGTAYTGLTATMQVDGGGPPTDLPHTYTFNLLVKLGGQIIPDNESLGTTMTIGRSFLDAVVDERGHVIVTYRLDFSFSFTPVVVPVRSLVCDVTKPAGLHGPHQDATHDPPLDMLDFSIVGSPAVMVSPRLYQVVIASVKNGALAQYTVNQEIQGGQFLPTLPFNTEVTFVIVGTPNLTLLSEFPGAHSVFLQASRRHLLWAVATLSNPFANSAQVFLRAIAVPDSTPPLSAGTTVQVGTTLGKFFFPLSVSAYGNPVMLLRPFDLLWATVVANESTQAIISELLYPVVAWKSTDDSIITLQETDTNFPVKDSTLARIASLKKLPNGVTIFGSGSSVQVFQAINDVSVLTTVGRKKTS